MKCLETEELVGYAYRLTDEPAASRVRAHLAECPRCLQIVEQHGRLDAVLSAWKDAEPSPSFDARVRQAIERAGAAREASWFRGWQWARTLALATLGVLLMASLVWFAHTRLGGNHSPQVATRSPQQIVPAPAAPQTATLHAPSVPVKVGRRSVRSVPEGKSLAVIEDKDSQALEDYDLAANFDLLSELPRTEQQVAN